jgi:hypothetical protein
MMQPASDSRWHGIVETPKPWTPLLDVVCVCNVRAGPKNLSPIRIDSEHLLADNASMNADTATADADTDAILKRMETGKPLDSDVYRRIRAEGARITESIRRKHGTLDIAVDLVRESRDEK